MAEREQQLTRPRFRVVDKRRTQMLHLNGDTPSVGKHTPIFGEKDARRTIVSFHNPGDVVDGKQLSEYVTSQYGYRTGHLPVQETRQPIALVLPGEQFGSVRQHIEGYLSHLYGKDIQAVTPANLVNTLNTEKNEPTLIVPYIRTDRVDAWLSSLAKNVEIFGVDPRFIHALNNKAEAHRRLEKAKIRGLEVPDFTIAPVNQVSEVANRFVEENVLGLYKNHLIMDYPEIGLMLRGAVGGGGFNNLKITEDSKRKRKREAYIHIESEVDDDGQPVYYETWQKALVKAQQLIGDTVDDDDEVVISRFVQTEDQQDGSPGLSAVILNGHFFSLGWSGQVMIDSACHGTRGYKPTSNYLKRYKKKYEAMTGDAFAEILSKIAKEEGIDYSQTTGFVQEDLLIPGLYERELRRRRRHQNPHDPYLIEFNIRPSNRGDALMLTTEMDKKIITVNNLLEQQQLEVFALDHYYLPEQAKPEEIRDIIMQVDTTLQKRTDGVTRVIDRMPTVPDMGIIFRGDIPRAQTALQGALKRYAEMK